jgi:hypothetical protein
MIRIQRAQSRGKQILDASTHRRSEIAPTIEDDGRLNQFARGHKASQSIQRTRIVRFVRSKRRSKSGVVSMDSCGVMRSPQTRQTLRTTSSFPGGATTTWAEIRGGQSSPEVIDWRWFAGCWNNMTFCLWGRGVELMID